MELIFIGDKQIQICTDSDFERLVQEYMGDDALNYLKEYYNNDSWW